MNRGFMIVSGVVAMAFCAAMLSRTFPSETLKLISGLILMPGGMLVSAFMSSGPSGGILFLISIFLANLAIYGVIWFAVAKLVGMVKSS